MTPEYLIRKIMLLLGFAGVNPFNQRWYSKIQFIVSELVLTIILVEMWLNCVHRWEGFGSMDHATMLPGNSQAILKLVILVNNRVQLHELLNTMSHFYINDKHETKQGKEVKDLLSFMKTFISVMMAAIMMMFGITFMKTFLSNTRALPAESYHPKNLDSSPGYEIVLGIQLTFMVFVAPALIGFDLLFVSLIVTIGYEMKILQRKFSSIRSDGYDQLSKLVRHHNTVLKCAKDVNEVYSFYLLNFLFLNVLCICIGLFAIVVSGFLRNPETSAFYGFFVLYYAIQLFFYSAAGSFLTAESEEVSRAVYDCEWWVETQPHFRKACVLVMQRSDKVEGLKAAKVFTLNLEHFTSVMRFCLSFFTFLQALYNGKAQ